MINYTKKNTYKVTLIITMISFCSINFLISTKNQINFNQIFNNQKDNEKIQITNIRQEGLNQSKENLIQENLEWSLKIPSINLNAQISEGTSKETMDKYVGHFEETSKENGNVGLAAHNRGYTVNYFENIRKLKIGDEIIYKYKEYEKKYKVNKMEIIKDTNWSYLENKGGNNVITLITCVENQPEYRRCIQAIEER